VSLQRKYSFVGGASLLSRIAGFLRDAVIAALLGAGPVADAFFAAFMLPNLARRMLAEGAFGAAFIPIFARREAKLGRVAALAFVDRVLVLLLGIGPLLALLAWPAMPLLLHGVAGGFADDAAKFALAIGYGRGLLAFVLLLLLVALLGAVLNALGRFVFPALAPALLNLVALSGLLAVVVGSPLDIEALGTAIVTVLTAAMLLQVLWLAGAAWRIGVLPVPRVASLKGAFSDPDVGRLALVALPGMLVAGAGHVNVLVAARVASEVPSAVAWLYYADRLFQLPLGFVAAAIGIVLLPSVARAGQAGEHAAVRDMWSRSLEFALALALPAAGALAILAGPIVDVLYRHGAFTPQDSVATATVLAVLATGLPGFVLVKLLLPAFVAHEQFRWPVIAAAAGIVANSAVSFLLLSRFGPAAPAIGVALSGWLNAGLLALGLAWRGGIAFDRLAIRRLPRILAAAALTLCAVALVRPMLVEHLAQAQASAIRLAMLVAACAAGALLHLGLLFVLRGIDMPRRAAA